MLCLYVEHLCCSSAFAKMPMPKFPKSDKKTHPEVSAKPSKLSIKTDLSASTTLHSNSSASASGASSGVTAMPIVSSPGWEIRYDPTLSEYYYVNALTNETQFDHPDEVLSPLDSPIGTTQKAQEPSMLVGSPGTSEHRKLFKGCALKRTISPRLFQAKRSSSPTPKTAVLMDIPTTEPDDDQDVEEFRRMLDLEMKNYEVERLRNP